MRDTLGGRQKDKLCYCELSTGAPVSYRTRMGPAAKVSGSAPTWPAGLPRCLKLSAEGWGKVWQADASLPGLGGGAPLLACQAVPTREAAASKVPLRLFPDEWAACSRGPEGRQTGRVGLGGAGAPTAAGRSESIFIGGAGSRPLCTAKRVLTSGETGLWQKVGVGRLGSGVQEAVEGVVG